MTKTIMKFELKIDEKMSLVIPELENADKIFSSIDKDRKHLSEWLSWVEDTKSSKDTRENLEKRIEEFNAGTAASFYVKYNDTFVASVGFISIDKENQKGEIGYWLLSEYQGKGVMTKSVEACINYGFSELNLNKIIIQCSGKNSKSAGIPKRLGFTQEGYLRQDRLESGKFKDTLIFGLLKEEWNKLFI